MKGSIRDMRQMQGRAQLYTLCSCLSYYCSAVSDVSHYTEQRVVFLTIHPAFCTFSWLCRVELLCVEPCGLEQGWLLSASFPSHPAR